MLAPKLLQCERAKNGGVRVNEEADLARGNVVTLSVARGGAVHRFRVLDFNEYHRAVAVRGGDVKREIPRGAVL